MAKVRREGGMIWLETEKRWKSLSGGTETEREEEGWSALKRGRQGGEVTVVVG